MDNNDSQTRILFIEKEDKKIEDGDDCDEPLYRLQKGWVLRFQKGPSILGNKMNEIHTNIPKDTDYSTSLDFAKNQILKWSNESEAGGDESKLYAEVPLKTAGCFNIWPQAELVEDEIDTYYFGRIMVEPALTYGPDNESLSLDSIACQSYSAKCLGPFDEWEKRLMVAKESGYNMIHITPVQELGEMNSTFCIKDHLKLNQTFNSATSSFTMDDLEKLINKMRTEWKVLTITDLVVNKVSIETPWLKDHPECTYNLDNCPYLRPAYLLDRVLRHLTLDIAEGKWESKGLPKTLSEEKHLKVLEDILKNQYFPQVKIEELYMMDIDAVVAEFKEKLKTKSYKSPPEGESYDVTSINIIQDPQYQRFKSTVDLDVACAVFGPDGSDDASVEKSCERFKEILQNRNKDMYLTVTEDHLQVAMNNILEYVRSEHIQSNGPSPREISKSHPLVPQYFAHFADTTLEEEEKLMYGKDACRVMVFSVYKKLDSFSDFSFWDDDTLLRRQLTSVGKGVLLRWRSAEEVPFLWNYMTKYLEMTARMFHGVRIIDSYMTNEMTLRYLLDIARYVRPDLYVITEIPDSFKSLRNYFMTAVGGITSYIYGASSIQNVLDQGKLVTKFGGEPVGSPVLPNICKLESSKPRAMLFESVPNGPSIVQKRTVYDVLPTAAILSVACNCATGSVRGYDELVPHCIEDDESRLYSSWSDNESQDPGFVSAKSGIIAGKKALNLLHRELGASNFNEAKVDDNTNKNIVIVTRLNPLKQQSVLLVAHTAFEITQDSETNSNIAPISFSGKVEEIIFEACLVKKGSADSYSKSANYINGSAEYQLDIRDNISVADSKFMEIKSEGCKQEMSFKMFPPGSVIVMRISSSS